MKSFNCIPLFITIFIIFIVVSPAFALEQKREKAWTGTIQGENKIKKTINEVDLAGILEEHKRWLDSSGKKGKMADLREADLQWV